MSDPLIKLHPESDFEKLLYANSFIEKQDKVIKGQAVEIGKLKSYIDEIVSIKGAERTVCRQRLTIKHLKKEVDRQFNQIIGLQKKIQTELLDIIN